MSETQNFPEWKSLPGTTLEGGYELKEIVEAAQESAVLRVRVLGDYTLRANASFYVLEAAKAEEQVGLWQTVRNFERKNNLSVPLGTGRLLIDGTAVAYLVFQNPDETLADVLGNRPLSPEEATDVLRAIARGSGELHANGFVHGNLSPEEVLAIGDAIDISTECIRRVNAEPVVERRKARYLAPESGTHNLTIASDVWCLGATVFEALTQKRYEPGLQEQAAALKHPFGTLVSSCLEPDPDKRCKLGELEAILRSKMPPSKPKPMPVADVQPVKAAMAGTAGQLGSRTEPAAEASTILAPSSVAAGNGKPATGRTEAVRQPVSSGDKAVESPTLGQSPKPGTSSGGKLPNDLAEGRKLPNELDPWRAASRGRAGAPAEEAPRGPSARRGWIYAIAAFLAIFFILWAVRSRHKPAGKAPVAGPQSTASNTGSGGQGSAAKTGSAWPTKTLTPDTKTAPASSESRSEVAAAPKAPATAGQAKTIWRVVLYTYNRQQDAQSKAQAISGKRPDLSVSVFSPGGGSGPYLVVAGGQMSRDEAARMRLRAIREGMPHDSYIQNYSK